MNLGPGGPSPFKRDRPASPFSRILNEFLLVQPTVVHAVFLDLEGECVDYATRQEPYDALVFGATLVPPTQQLLRASSALGSGAPILWLLEAERADVVVRRVSDEHVIALGLARASISVHVLHAIGPLAELLRQEAGFPVSDWDPEGEPLEVTTRKATGWGYAPHELRAPDGSLREIEVLGRWAERGAVSAQESFCFRVRCGGEELTLVHERRLDRWYRR